MKFLIGGLPRHGKTEAARIIAARLNLTYGNTSDTIYAELAKERGCTVASLESLPKETLRSALIAKGDNLCLQGGPAFLALTQLDKHDVVCGVRKPIELSLVREKYPKSVFLWITRPDYDAPKDNTLLSQLDADYVVVNDGSLNDLEAKIAQFIVMSSLGLKHPGNSLWNLLHWFAFQRDWSENERAQFLQAFGTILFITARDCPCAITFEAIKKVFPPPSVNSEFWNWTLIVHDWVNHKRGVPLRWEWTRGHPAFKALQEAFSSNTPEGLLTDTARQPAPVAYCKPCK